MLRITAMASAVLITIGFSLLGAAPVLGAELVLRPPTDAPVLDPFRPPSGPFGPGNRGIEYATEPGDLIRAAADGTVTFVGAVGGNLFVTVAHGSGLRTTYGFVGHTLVRRGAAITEGEVVAEADGPFHFTLRRDRDYLDPVLWFGVLERRVWLVPHVGSARPQSPQAPSSGWAAAWARVREVPAAPGGQRESSRYTPLRPVWAPDGAISAPAEAPR